MYRCYQPALSLPLKFTIYNMVDNMTVLCLWRFRTTPRMPLKRHLTNATIKLVRDIVPQTNSHVFNLSTKGGFTLQLVD